MIARLVKQLSMEFGGCTCRVKIIQATVCIGSRMEAERPGRRDEDVAAGSAASCGCGHRFRGHSGADTLVLLHCKGSSNLRLQ